MMKGVMNQEEEGIDDDARDCFDSVQYHHSSTRASASAVALSPDVVKHVFPFEQSMETSIVDSFTKDGFVILQNVLPAEELRQSWSPYASQCFRDCFRILYENGHIAAPTDKINNAYTTNQGIKHGFAEFVMRSPGRYEISLRHLLFEKKQFCSIHDDKISSLSLPPLPYNPEELLLPLQSLLPRLLDINTHGEENNHDFNNNNNRSSESESVSILSSEMNLIHVSLLVATPGSSDQAWHADGGHVSLEQHLPCHCYNVFIALQDTPHTLGPTELRPESHFLTRGSLPKNMLAAKCRKTLQAPVWPALSLGDVLIFDYRILHRGRANNSSSSNNNNLANNRSYLVLTYAQPWFQDVLNFPKHPSIYQTTKIN
ncbi:phytanoyl-CoA dioxygenase family protein [Nitzschia inconspicua]|uniref:Phytanoyl-CoA dioxygenase family protein n=1 Tax=Nitzschia inconspicua TaxID=303405 RepID=A0A9K3Q9S9_9STRA|nr:phytanoyl-CoA dioxygenase family protein [Nitzschia inconspicua]